MQPRFRAAVLCGTGFVLYAVMDLLWIGVVAAPVYRSEVGPLLILGEGMSGARIVAASATWLLISLAVVCFALPRASRRAGAALGWGALMGFVIYGVYDLTNYAVLRGWTLKVTVLDIAWGTFACAVTSLALNGVERWLLSARHGSS